MNIKLIAAGCLVAAGLGYLALKPKAKEAAEVTPVTKTESSEPAVHAGESIPVQPSPAKTATAEVTQPTEEPSTNPTPVDQTTQESLTETLKADKELAKVAQVNSVECLDGKCTVELEAKGEENVQMSMLSFLADHREEYGRYSKFDESKENPKVTRFVISKEKL